MSLSSATQPTKEDVTRDDPPRHEWLEVIGGRYVSALLAALREDGRGGRLTGWGRALTWRESRGAQQHGTGLEEGTRVSFQNLK
jgi:hypothetical protein